MSFGAGSVGSTAISGRLKTYDGALTGSKRVWLLDPPDSDDFNGDSERAQIIIGFSIDYINRVAAELQLQVVDYAAIKVGEVDYIVLSRKEVDYAAIVDKVKDYAAIGLKEVDYAAIQVSEVDHVD
jgi:hypothetical protein